MGNILSDTSITSDKNKINELSFEIEALKKQNESLKQIIQKEGKIISDLERELKEFNKCLFCSHNKKD